jgi:hypothetical protein
MRILIDSTHYYARAGSCYGVQYDDKTGAFYHVTNRPILEENTDIPSTLGLKHIETDARLNYIFEVINKKLFFLSVFKYGLEFELINEGRDDC